MVGSSFPNILYAGVNNNYFTWILVWDQIKEKGKTLEGQVGHWYSRNENQYHVNVIKAQKKVGGNTIPF